MIPGDWDTTSALSNTMTRITGDMFGVESGDLDGCRYVAGEQTKIADLAGIIAADQHIAGCRLSDVPLHACDRAMTRTHHDAQPS